MNKDFLLLTVGFYLTSWSPGGAAAPLFVDRAEAWGLDFVHFNGMSGELYFPEMTGQGGAFVDYDGDGDLDVYLVQGTLLGPDKSLSDALFPPQGPLLDRLFRNDLSVGARGDRRVQFTDVTENSGIRAPGYGMGVAVGDYDNDGWVDLYVTNYGPNQMWRNSGDGTFSDATAITGTSGESRWSTSAAFLDFDDDGWLDLYVVNYVEFDLARNPQCFARSSRRDYCGPAAFDPQPDRLYRNQRDGTFKEITYTALTAYRPGPGLGVVAADFNGDDRVDLYVANDGQPNQLWINGRNGVFTEDALFSGVAVNRQGRPEASMGVDAADFDGDGDEDLFMTHLTGESNTLYVNDGRGLFEDRSTERGLAHVSLPYTAFGTGWLDYDNDGLLDLIVLNGAVRIQAEQAAAGELFPLKQPNQLFRNLGGSFGEVTSDAGEAFALPEVSRGAALGDIDNDGDTDVLQLNNNGRARLLINESGSRRPWLGLVAIGSSGYSALGTRLKVRTRAGDDRWRRVRTDGGYCSANDPRLTVGLGDSSAPSLELHWPGGKVVRWLRPQEQRYLEFSINAAGALNDD